MGGFMGGAVAALSLSALGLGVLAVSAPPVAPPTAPPTAAQTPVARMPVAPAAGDAPLLGVAAAAGAPRATEAPLAAAPAAPAPVASALAPDPVAPRQTPTPQPPILRNAAAFTASGGPLVGVIVTVAEPVSPDAARVLGLRAPLTLALDPADGGAALAERAHAAGFEVVSRGPSADAAAVGLARARWDGAARAQAQADGLLTLALEPPPAGNGATAAAPEADVIAAFSLDGAASAERVFQTLQEAARRADADKGVAVALVASDAALTGLARWLAVTDADVAPVSALAR